jgi:hypothetical protein
VIGGPGSPELNQRREDGRLMSVLLLVFVVALVALVAPACSSGGDSAFIADGKLTVCSESP